MKWIGLFRFTPLRWRVSLRPGEPKRDPKRVPSPICGAESARDSPDAFEHRIIPEVNASPAPRAPIRLLRLTSDARLTRSGPRACWDAPWSDAAAAHKDEILGVRLRSSLARPGGHRHFSRLHFELIVRELDRRGVLFTRRWGRRGEFGAGWTAERSQKAQLRLEQQRHGVRRGFRTEDRPVQTGPAELSKESFQASAEFKDNSWAPVDGWNLDLL